MHNIMGEGEVPLANSFISQAGLSSKQLLGSMCLLNLVPLLFRRARWLCAMALLAYYERSAKQLSKFLDCVLTVFPLAARFLRADMNDS